MVYRAGPRRTAAARPHLDGDQIRVTIEEEAMLAAFLVLAAMPDLVPARWISNDPKSLDLLRDTPVNCLFIEQPQWSARLNEEAAARGITTLGVIHPGSDAMPAAQKLATLHFAGAVLEGSFTGADADRV